MFNSVIATKAAALVSVPWDAFVAAFLFYSFLTVIALSGVAVPLAVMLGAYALPPALWAGTVALRLSRIATGLLPEGRAPQLQASVNAG